MKKGYHHGNLRQALVDAARKAGVPRFIFVTAIALGSGLGARLGAVLVAAGALVITAQMLALSRRHP